MSAIMTFNCRYFAAFIVLFIIETCIALFVHDSVVRPFIGDVLVVILIYCFIKSFINRPLRQLPLYVFLFAVMVEVAQWFRIVERLHWQDNVVLSTIVGTSFSWIDIFCYLAGMLVLCLWQKAGMK